MRAILGGECTAALAGDTTVMTNPLWFQNLAGASFLSPTGACKPFDAKADGYCRGEGIAAVFLKKMSKAVADGDPIIGCIGGTAVYQNENCTPIFVPNSHRSPGYSAMSHGKLDLSQRTSPLWKLTELEPLLVIRLSMKASCKCLEGRSALPHCLRLSERACRTYRVCLRCYRAYQNPPHDPRACHTATG